MQNKRKINLKLFSAIVACVLVLAVTISLSVYFGGFYNKNHQTNFGANAGQNNHAPSNPSTSNPEIEPTDYVSKVINKLYDMGMTTFSDYLDNGTVDEQKLPQQVNKQQLKELSAKIWNKFGQLEAAGKQVSRLDQITDAQLMQMIETLCNMLDGVEEY